MTVIQHPALHTILFHWTFPLNLGFLSITTATNYRNPEQISLFCYFVCFSCASMTRFLLWRILSNASDASRACPATISAYHFPNSRFRSSSVMSSLCAQMQYIFANSLCNFSLQHYGCNFVTSDGSESIKKISFFAVGVGLDLPLSHASTVLGDTPNTDAKAFCDSFSRFLVPEILTSGRLRFRTIVAAFAFPFSYAKASSSPSIMPEKKSVFRKFSSISASDNRLRNTFSDKPITPF